MTRLRLVAVPDERLRQKSEPVKTIDKRILKLVADMAETLRLQKNPPGVGLAAIQVGVAKRIFLIKPQGTITVMINPELVEKRNEGLGKEKEKAELLEGCLSIPEHFGQIKRAGMVRLKYTSLDLGEMGKEEVKPVQKETVFRGLTARIVQHEMDHLDGKLFVDEIISQKEKLLRLHEGKWHEVNLQ